jgi:hypothetical protein
MLRISPTGRTLCFTSHYDQGIERRKIFRNDKNREDFLEQVKFHWLR